MLHYGSAEGAIVASQIEAARLRKFRPILRVSPSKMAISGAAALSMAWNLVRARWFRRRKFCGPDLSLQSLIAAGRMFLR